MIITEPKWKKWVVETLNPIFTPKLCQEIIDLSKELPKKSGTILLKGQTKPILSVRSSTVTWLPFDRMTPMYDDLDTFIQKTNRNHFGFNDIRITEPAQFSEYQKGDFYDWHMDTELFMDKEPPVRKLSMTLLLNDPKEFEGGDLIIAGLNASPKQKGKATIFASFLQHKVTPVTRGIRKSLVMWFGGEPFK
jgi:PKHD-type hydroxylase|tara:strand:+ start:645 stop:1220 length:576 start_codon:yes stop_codon:yes gene_type:complete